MLNGVQLVNGVKSDGTWHDGCIRRSRGTWEWDGRVLVDDLEVQSDDRALVNLIRVTEHGPCVLQACKQARRPRAPFRPAGGRTGTAQRAVPTYDVGPWVASWMLRRPVQRLGDALTIVQ